ncbi:metacaspase-2 isoform X1 [Hydra vulgaris]|uniref:metacaspase-2 isoform X1 n=1 Tax=Hydra vulgaris TaxID=6087 RepID=UPI001F5FD9B4|nr:metacaspase-2 isoform X1 [Hydra vulgaris]
MFKSKVVPNGDFKKNQERKTVALRHKTSRYSVVSERRKMSEDLNNGSISDSAVKSKNFNRNEHSSNSRSALLQEWRLKKEKIKNQESKNAKAKFVVKHVEHKINIYTEHEKEPISAKPTNPKSIIPKNSKSVLKEKNTNINHTQSKQNDFGKDIKQDDSVRIRKQDDSGSIRKNDYSLRIRKNNNSEIRPLSSKNENTKISKESSCRNNAKVSSKNNQPLNNRGKSLKQNLADDKKMKSSMQNHTLSDDKKMKSSMQNHTLSDDKKMKSSMQNHTLSNDKKVVDKQNVLSELFGSESMIEKLNEFSFEEIQKNVCTNSETFIVGSFSFEPPLGLSNINFEYDKSPKKDLFHLQSPDIDSKNRKSSSGALKKLKMNKTGVINHCHSENDVASTNNVELLNVASVNNTAIKNIASLKLEKEFNSPMNTEGFVNSLIRTPISMFKKKEGIPQEMLFISPNINKKNITPNPKNFFSMNEDPVAQRINSPLRIESAPNPKVSDSVENFTKLVATEEAIFTSSLNKWNKILENGVPEEVQGDILAAIGQAQLFTQKRFKQFKELIELHKDKNAEKVALASDLDGFWDMIYFQVKDVHKRFSELDVLEKNNWQKEICHQNEQKEKPINKKKHAIKKNIQPNVINKDKKRTDFRQFRQQMMLKSQENKVDTVFNELDPLSFNSMSKDKNYDAVVVNDEFSADSLEETSPDKHLILNKENCIPLSNLRRSTRKTPSKYRFIESQKMTPKSVACKLFTGSIARHDLQPTSEFTKYLSKTIVLEDASAKCDLLSSFDDVQSEVKPQPKQFEDLMMFSPLNR